MWQHHDWGRALAALFGCSWLAVAGCQSPGSQRIVGPDGSPMAHVHCGADQGACFRVAGELCPSGYDIKPVLRGSDGNFLVRCRNAGTPALATPCTTPPPSAAPPVVASRPAPTPAVAAKAPASKDVWPPTAEPSPPANPWGEVDLGY
jgi:hypothetical protein